MRRPSFDLSRLRNFSFRNLDLSPRQRKVLRIAGMVMLGIVTFLFTLHFTFPYDRVEGKLVEALSSKYDVTVGSTGHGWLPGTIVLEDVKLRSRPTRPDEKPTEIVIDRVVVDLGLDFNLFAVIRKKLVLDIDAELGGGEVEAELDLSSSYVEATLETEGLPLGKVPGLASAVGLPMTGGLDADVELRLPGGKFRNAEGHIQLACNDCTIGDGTSKISMSPPKASSRRRSSRTAAGWGDEARSITVPKLQLGEFKAVLDISKGVGQIKELGASSKDGWFKITGKVEFRDPFASSLFPACMQFRLSDELKKREPTFGNIEYGISEKVRKPDGSFSIPTKGKLTELKFDPRQMCGGGSAEDEEGGEGDGVAAAAGRPSLAPGLPTTENGAEGVPPVAEGVPQPPEGVPAPGASGPPMGAGQDAGAAPPTPGEPPPPPQEEPGRPPSEDSREKDRDPEDARERDRERDDDSRGDEQREQPRDSQGSVD